MLLRTYKRREGSHRLQGEGADAIVALGGKSEGDAPLARNGWSVVDRRHAVAGGPTVLLVRHHGGHEAFAIVEVASAAQVTELHSMRKSAGLPATPWHGAGTLSQCRAAIATRATSDGWLPDRRAENARDSGSSPLGVCEVTGPRVWHRMLKPIEAE